MQRYLPAWFIKEKLCLTSGLLYGEGGLLRWSRGHVCKKHTNFLLQFESFTFGILSKISATFVRSLHCSDCLFMQDCWVIANKIKWASLPCYKLFLSWLWWNNVVWQWTKATLMLYSIVYWLCCLVSWCFLVTIIVYYPLPSTLNNKAVPRYSSTNYNIG